MILRLIEPSIPSLCKVSLVVVHSQKMWLIDSFSNLQNVQSPPLAAF
ncbi:hypothetical protein ES319_A03G049700v1 [Gossypium barbadense]|uniref:Uncharacterized protein n=1 Tax=Gossypium barbadense TaxID=3634 RepID=A0A5J5WDJ0_GOSBA|nr:hypothetical protein ES319_A03G049700v1 [Gossypium barbadense]